MSYEDANCREMAQALCAENVEFADMYKVSLLANGGPALLLALLALLCAGGVLAIAGVTFSRGIGIAAYVGSRIFIVLVAGAVSVVAIQRLRARGLSRNVIIAVTGSRVLLMSARFSGTRGWHAVEVIETWPLKEVKAEKGPKPLQFRLMLNDGMDLTLNPKWVDTEAARIASRLTSQESNSDKE